MRTQWVLRLAAVSLVVSAASLLLCVVLFGRVNDRADELKVTALELKKTADRLEKTAKDVVRASRAGCRRDNVVRENQAANFSDQIEATEQQLRQGLGPLEGFRAQILRQNNQRRKRRRRLIPIPPDRSLPGRPYALNCRSAYPFAP